MIVVACLLMQVQSRVVESLPDILSLNCQLEHSKDVEFWKKQEHVSSVCMSTDMLYNETDHILIFSSLLSVPNDL